MILNQPVLDSPQEVLDLFTETHYTGQYYYRPITKLAYVTQKALFGGEPGPYHAVNVAIIGIIFLLFCALLARASNELSSTEACFFSLLLCIHPVTSSTVYAIAGLDTLIVTALCLASLLLYLKNDWISYLGAIFILVLAFLSKEHAAILPPIMIASDLLLNPNSLAKPNRRRLILRWIPILMMTAAYLLVRLTVFGGKEFASTTEINIAGPIKSVLFTLQVSFAPFYSLIYEPDLKTWFSLPRSLASLLVCSSALYFLARSSLALRTRAMFWCVFFFIAILPTANLVRQETLYAERYAFVALIAVSGFLSVSYCASSTYVGRASYTAIGLTVLAILGAITINRGTYFRDDLAFSTQWMLTNPAHPSARLLYGNSLMRENRITEAISHMEESATMHPGVAQIQNSLGVLYAVERQYESAHLQFKKALDANPRYFEPQLNLAVLAMRLENAALAKDELEKAIEINARSAEAHYRMGVLFSQDGDIDLAEQHWRRALQADPDHAPSVSALRKKYNALGN